MTVTFQPLIGEKKLIDKFRNTAFEHYDIQPSQHAWAYSVYHGDVGEMCTDICEKYPGITFYGYYKEDNTCGQYIFRQIIFNKEDGLIFAGRKAYEGEADVWPIFEDVSIRGEKIIQEQNDNGEFVECNKEKQNDDVNGGYALEPSTEEIVDN